MKKIKKSWKDDAAAIHRKIAAEHDIHLRIRGIADAFTGRPYLADSLVGGPKQPEKMVVNLKAFDCVTFIESVFALARSRSSAGFLTELKHIRYRDGLVEWRSRLHYFSDWLKRNHARGTVRNRTHGPGSRRIETSLSFIEELPARRTRFHVVPKRKIRLARRRIENGSVVAFASVRSRLDFFHTGLLFFQGHELLLCHASRSARKVMTEPLIDFLNRNLMRGMAFAAPCPPGKPR